MSTYKTQKHALYRKTYVSRCMQNYLSRGFTLIELLVVISIISLLSTLVLSAISDARVKARNSAKNSLVMEYIKALELYRNTYNTYPIENTEVCFGYSTNEECYINTPGSNNLKNSLSEYFSGDFAHRTSLIINGIDFKGVKYQCIGTLSCEKYSLVWVLEKQLNQCVSGATHNPNYSGNTHCIYPESN